MAEPRKSVFVSYAHEDRQWADTLMRYLAPWIRQERVDLWDDSRLQFGADWAAEIQAAMEQASVAVLLVTSHFWSSDFIAEHELPFLLDRAARGQLRIAWIAVEHSSVSATDLAGFQAINDPARPLNSLSRPDREKVLVDIAQRIADAVTISALGGGLQVIDESFEPISAYAERRPVDGSYVPSVRAQYDARADEVSFAGAAATISADDLKNLPADDREFIADLEDSLRTNYERWSKVKKQLGDAGGALDGEVRTQLDRIVGLICDDLNGILDFVRRMHKAELEDHYHRYRYLCSTREAG